MRIKLTPYGLDKFIGWGNHCLNGGLTEMDDRIARQIGIKGLNNVKAIAPKRTGRLKQSLTIGATENYFKVEVAAGKVVVIYGTTVPYAEAVERGYDQKNRVSKATGKKPTLFVPGYWSSGTFHYVPGAKEGMLLTGRIVEGAHMFQKSMDDTKDDAKEIILSEFRRLYGALF